MTIKNPDGQTLLIIDDEPAWRRLLQRFLTDAGYTVHTAATCAEGVKHAELHKPDCILLDFHLIDGDAVSVCRAIRSIESIKNTPVIIFSGDPSAETPAYTQCLADRFILKGSISMAELAARVATALHAVPPAPSVRGYAGV